MSTPDVLLEDSEDEDEDDSDVVLSDELEDDSLDSVVRLREEYEEDDRDDSLDELLDWLLSVVSVTDWEVE